MFSQCVCVCFSVCVCVCVSLSLCMCMCRGVDVENLYSLVIERVERPLIELTLKATRGNQIRAAQILGINRNTLRKKITHLHINVKDSYDE